MSGDFEIEGLNELTAKLNAMGNRGKEIEGKALTAAAEIMRDAIESNVPESVLTRDHAKNFIIIGAVKDGVIAVGPNAKHYYLRFPEFGTSKQPAQGFMERAFNDKKEAAKKAMSDVIREEIG